MDAYDIRHQNFMALFAQYKAARPSEPQRGMLKGFAESAGMSDRIASHYKGRRKQIGSATARRVERSLGKPHGWLDVPHPVEGTRTPSAEVEEEVAGEVEFIAMARRLYALDKAIARQVMVAMIYASFGAARASQA